MGALSCAPMNIRPGCLAVLASLLGLPLTARAADALSTIAEQSGFQRTGRYDEVERLCAAYERHWKDAVRCIQFGRSPEGRPMLALVISRTGALTPDEARKRNLPVLLIQGGIHAGEIDGKDAGFLAAVQMLEERAAPAALKSFVLVFVPVFNVDGHERFGRWNRPNQTGPEEMGWRVTSQNLNLNRDYTKADAPEMEAMLRLLGEWDPILYVDMHVTDGAQFQPAVSLNFMPNHLSLHAPEITPGTSELNRLSAALEEQVRVRLDREGYLPITFYPDFVQDDEPASGFQDELSTPRFSQGYWALRNRIGFLLETHSWKNYKTRVQETHDTLDELVSRAARDGKSWLGAAHLADKAAEKLGGSHLVLRYETSAKSHTIPFQGYAYKKIQSEISGHEQIVYDPSHKQVWNIPLFDDLQPAVSVTLPQGGYLIE